MESQLHGYRVTIAVEDENGTVLYTESIGIDARDFRMNTVEADGVYEAAFQAARACRDRILDRK